MAKKGKQYAIRYQPTKTNFESAWVLDESYRVALYASERSAQRDLKDFIHPKEYEVLPWPARARRSGL